MRFLSKFFIFSQIQTLILTHVDILMYTLHNFSIDLREITEHCLNDNSVVFLDGACTISVNFCMVIISVKPKMFILIVGDYDSM